MTKDNQGKEQKLKDEEKDVSVLKPSNQEKKIQKPEKKRRGCFWGCLIILIIFILVPLILIGASGFYNIPVISNVFGANKPVDLGVKTSPEALKKAMDDNPMNLIGEPTEYYGVRNKKFSGKVEIDDQNTSEEVTSWIEHYTQGAPYAEDIQVKYIEGGMEISAFVKPYIKAPVYIKIGVTKASDKSVNIELEKAKVGIIPVPSQFYDDIEEIAEEIINDRIAGIKAFTIEELEYHDGYADFKGTLPKKIEPAQGEWLDLGG